MFDALIRPVHLDAISQVASAHPDLAIVYRSRRQANHRLAIGSILAVGNVACVATIECDVQDFRTDD